MVPLVGSAWRVFYLLLEAIQLNDARIAVEDLDLVALGSSAPMR